MDGLSSAGNATSRERLEERRPSSSPLQRDRDVPHVAPTQVREQRHPQGRRRIDGVGIIIRIQRWWRRVRARRRRTRSKRERMGNFAAYRIQRVWRLWRWRVLFVDYSERYCGWLGTIEWLKRNNFLYGTELADTSDTTNWHERRKDAPLDREVDPWGCGKMQEHMARMWSRENDIVERHREIQEWHAAAEAYAYPNYHSRLVPKSRVLSQSPPRTTRPVDKLRPVPAVPPVPSNPGPPQISTRSPRGNPPQVASAYGNGAFARPAQPAAHRPQSQPPAQPTRGAGAPPPRDVLKAGIRPQRAVSSAASARCYPTQRTSSSSMQQRMLMVRGR